ncbi:5'-methylthioadenosine/adenosylhomocysteine nucleosidase [Fructobacillus evanidus]|uniref:adenosylhomocysteine nucleosidase n=1 Tax=Fructobacillus evanidus TaxID=3064281 RepID=A0ABN9YYC0_9LACO|nr:Nucleoside phosphorylase/nucleosidase [Fructobacillus sp. LMG 32999]CAK1242268.1 Nucleoside phosphorylase/nucleosidase [Fructobacillus sp. LMG 32999]CAK1249228.1 Nucleoside phosphorylase/nucleosidase [Fructobacillus sp. LMG 32999]CAK1249323.1 Nucleoside phosphorylase/nucleosidase [Fructobacillus sp. LMG 32999]CAK1249639.1 Nucleoside phosphorylase/nucleosidase [Fructobacillus sp. LMG 32999]
MKVGIITPMPEEKKALTNAIQNPVEKSFADLTVLVGKYAGQEIFLAESGIGKVAAATATTILTQVFHVDVVINTGSAGALQPELAIGDLVIGTKLTYFDADVTVFGYDFGQLPAQPAYFEADADLVKAFEALTDSQAGLIVSGDSFVQQDKKEEIKQHFPKALLAEMEGAAVAQVATRFNVPFIVLRGVSDLANGESSVTFDEFVVEAGQKSAQLLLAYLDSLSA